MQDYVANPTLLHFAARYNLVKLAVAILSCPGGYGALNMQNIDQLTPSQIAHECGHESLAIVLVRYRAYTFGHLLKTVELVQDKIPFFWYPSTENGRLRRLQIAFYESPFFWSFCFR